MDKYRRYLNQYNVNPFASRRQINNYKETLQRENPAMLEIQPADESGNSDHEIFNDEDRYVPNSAVTAKNIIKYVF